MSRITRRLAAALLVAAPLALGACGGSKPRAATPPAPRETAAGIQPTQSAGVSTVTGDDISKVPVQRIEEYLNGRVPGLQVFRDESGNYSIRIRGSQKFGQGGEEPLLVLDGFPVQPGSVSTVLAGLNPQEIARVEVLKDASSTAMYGSRGANGVLVIKTKRGAAR